MPIAPTRISYNAPAANFDINNDSSKVTNTFDFLAGDYIVVQASCENGSSRQTVTPFVTSGAGSVSWFNDCMQPITASTVQSDVKLWTGVAGASVTGASITLNRMTGATATAWGFTATVVRGVSGKGQLFQGDNGTVGSSAPQLSAACAANSLALCQINDWNAVDGASRTWVSNNGTPEVESLYYRDASRHTVYGGYIADTGAAQTITQGLSTPSTMRWAMVGIELLGMPDSAPVPLLQETGAGILLENGQRLLI